jgi:hypothetical protein
MPSAPDDPTFWQSRAAEARASATQITDPLCRTAMLALAARYERLARRLIKDGDIFGTAGRTPSC